MKKYRNLTRHAIAFLAADDSVIAVIEPDKVPARCRPSVEVVGSLKLNGFDVPVRQTVMGDITGLPAMDPGLDTYYIVSRVVAEAESGRPDLLIVDDTVRGEGGQIIGCRAFGRLQEFFYEDYLRYVMDDPTVQVIQTSDESGKGYGRTLVVRSDEKVEDEIFHNSIRRIQDEPDWADLLPVDAGVFDPTTLTWVTPTHLCEVGTDAYRGEVAYPI